MDTMDCPIKGCRWMTSGLIDLSGKTPNLQDEIDSVTTQYSLLVEHLQESHDGRVGGRA